MIHFVNRIALFIVCVTFIAFVPFAPFAEIPQMPMPIPHEDSAVHAWLAKPVLESRLLDDMESSATWSHHGRGEMSFTDERAKDGKQSIRLVSPTKTDKHPGGRPFGEVELRRDFKGEDWRDWNRLSFWIYPRLPGFKIISMSVRLHNDGERKLPNHDLREGLNFFILEPDKWNHVVWEITHLGRERVTGVSFVYRLQGHEPGATDTVQYDVDHLELQKVEPDHFEGWAVAPGKIAFSHSGYLTGAKKSAIASGIDAKQFELIDAASNKAVLTKPIAQTKSAIGEFQVMDFSEFDKPGRYFLRAGKVQSPAFPIGENVWRDSIIKTINFFYCERCGTAIPGIHDECHKDWLCVHGDKKIAMNGGWHDAGDLSQGCVNTAESAYGMFALAERLGGSDPELRDRLIEEGKWGLDWLLKTRFGDGYRASWGTMDFWTDGKVGTPDDADSRASNGAHDNFLAAATEAIAARLLKSSDPKRAELALQAARDDWRFAVAGRRDPRLETIAAGAFASIELYKATGEQPYIDKAIELADVILNSQQREPMAGWKIPLAGFLYSSPEKRRVLRYSHRSHEQQPVAALVALCEALPDHARRADWLRGVELYGDYMRKVSRLSEPYFMLPASIYSTDEQYPEQIRKGIPLDDTHYLRFFPVWTSFRGNNGVLLSQAKALSGAARLTGDRELRELATRQLEWVVGRNPFSESTMYGEGHHFAPQYTAMSGDLVGSLPVGIETRYDEDVPYWPAQNCYNYKEVWVHPSARWLAIMADLVESR